jgi:hypothetical protein
MVNEFSLFAQYAKARTIFRVSEKKRMTRVSIEKYAEKAITAVMGRTVLDIADYIQAPKNTAFGRGNLFRGLHLAELFLFELDTLAKGSNPLGQGRDNNLPSQNSTRRRREGEHYAAFRSRSFVRNFFESSIGALPRMERMS